MAQRQGLIMVVSDTLPPICRRFKLPKNLHQCPAGYLCLLPDFGESIETFMTLPLKASMLPSRQHQNETIEKFLEKDRYVKYGNVIMCDITG